MTDQEKLERLCEIEGMTEEAVLRQSVYDSMIPAICMNDGCDYTAEMEVDQTKGWCEECQTQSLKSAAILAGIV